MKLVFHKQQTSKYKPIGVKIAVNAYTTVQLFLLFGKSKYLCDSVALLKLLVNRHIQTYMFSVICSGR
jgi:hypothetical protein